MSSRNYHHGDLKTALIQAALVLLKNEGLGALSLRTLAAKVGVSHMAPYAHFKNKTELFQSISAHGFNDMADKMDAIDKNQSPEALILAYGSEYIKYAINNAPLYRLMLSQTQVTGPQASSGGSHMSSELRKASMRPYKLLLGNFINLFPEDKEKQSLQAQGAWAIVHGLSALIIDGHLQIPEGMSVSDYLLNSTMAQDAIA